MALRHNLASEKALVLSIRTNDREIEYLKKQIKEHKEEIRQREKNNVIYNNELRSRY